MSIEETKKNQELNKEKTAKFEDAAKHKTDPQEDMKGIVSSLVQVVKKESENKETLEEAEKRKEENF